MELHLDAAVAVMELDRIEMVTENFQDTTKDFVHITLKTALNNYLDTHPQLSLHSISLRSGVSFTTLSRLMKSKSIQAISPHTVLNLSAFLWKEYRLEYLVDTVPRILSQFLYSHFGRFMVLRN